MPGSVENQRFAAIFKRKFSRGLQQNPAEAWLLKPYNTYFTPVNAICQYRVIADLIECVKCGAALKAFAATGGCLKFRIFVHCTCTVYIE